MLTQSTLKLHPEHPLKQPRDGYLQGFTRGDVMVFGETLRSTEYPVPSTEYPVYQSEEPQAGRTL